MVTRDGKQLTRESNHIYFREYLARPKIKMLLVLTYIGTRINIKSRARIVAREVSISRLGCGVVVAG